MLESQPINRTRKAAKQQCELDLLRDSDSDDMDSIVLSLLSCTPATAYAFAAVVANTVAPSAYAAIAV
jgi:hypothetical protein